MSVQEIDEARKKKSKGRINSKSFQKRRRRMRRISGKGE